MSSQANFHAVVRPMMKEWERFPNSLYFQVQPPIEIADPVGVGAVISDNLYGTPDRVRVTPVIGKTDDATTSGFLLRGHHPEIGESGLFGTKEDVEKASVVSALQQLVSSSCDVEFIDIPVTY